MSLILKGIDMPEKENRMYMMELYADGHCSVAKIEDGECYELTIPSETEAIQIPKGHGRLIDGDKIQDKAYKRYFNNTISSYGLFEVNRAIENAPTILEAED